MVTKCPTCYDRSLSTLRSFRFPVGWVLGGSLSIDPTSCVCRPASCPTSSSRDRFATLLSRHHFRASALRQYGEVNGRRRVSRSQRRRSTGGRSRPPLESALAAASSRRGLRDIPAGLAHSESAMH